jgi:hypothetical protein
MDENEVIYDELNKVDGGVLATVEDIGKYLAMLSDDEIARITKACNRLIGDYVVIPEGFGRDIEDVIEFFAIIPTRNIYQKMRAENTLHDTQTVWTGTGNVYLTFIVLQDGQTAEEWLENFLQCKWED